MFKKISIVIFILLFSFPFEQSAKAESINQQNRSDTYSDLGISIIVKGIDQSIPNELVNALIQSVSKLGAELGNAKTFGVISFEPHSAWAFISISPIDSTLLNNEASPLIFTYICVDKGGWKVALVDSPSYYEILNTISTTALTSTEKDELQGLYSLYKSNVASPETINGPTAYNYSFPWDASQNPWELINKYHGPDWGNSNSVDLIPPTSVPTAWALAMADGKVTLVVKCTWNAVIKIQHDTNYEDFVYLHLQKESVPDSIYTGALVKKGQFLGNLRVPIPNNGNWEYDYNPATGNLCSKSTGRHLHLGLGSQSMVIDGISATDLVNGQFYNSLNGLGSCGGPSLGSPKDDGYISPVQTISFDWSPPSNCTYSGYTFRIKDVPTMDSGGNIVTGDFLGKINQPVDTGLGGQSISVTINSTWNNRDLYWGVRTANPISLNWSVRRFRIQPTSSGPWAYQLFSLGDLNGDKLESAQTYGNLADVGWNDRAESMRINSGYSIIGCQHDNFHGFCGRATASATSPLVFSDLNAFYQGLRDQMTSIRACQGTCPPAPDSPTLTFPSNNYYFQAGNNITLTWSGNAAQYSGQLWGGAFGSNTQYFGGNSNTQYNAGQLAASADPYSWKVQGYTDLIGESGWTQASFYVINPPNPPGLVFPFDSGVVTNQNVNFSWQTPNSQGQTGYTFRLSTSSNPDTQPWIVNTDLDNSIATYQYSFSGNGIYYWHMRTWNAAGQASNWVTRQFTIQACYTLTTSINPAGAGSVTANPTPNCNSGTQYTSGTVVQLLSTPGTGFSFLNWSGSLTGSNNPANITIDSDKSVTANFRDIQSPSVTWISPVGDAQTYNVGNQTVQLEVTATDNVGVTSAHFSRWDYVNLVSVDIGTVTTSPYRISFDTSVLLPQSNEIDVDVRDSAGNYTHKYIWLYHIPGPFNKVSPFNGGTLIGVNPTLSWGTSSGISSYEYCHDTTNDNICNGTWMSTGTNTSVNLSGLNINTTYYWQVRAVNAAGPTYADNGTWWSFSTQQNPTPTLTSINPTGILNGNVAFILTANGSNYINDSVVKWGNINLPTTFVNSTRLTASVPASYLTSAGTINITIFNPAPGGGTSSILPFNIYPPDQWFTNGPYSKPVNKIVVSKTSPNIIYAGVFGGDSDMFRSDDGGANWIEIINGFSHPYINELAVDPTNSAIVYAGLDVGGIYKTTDSGANWVPINNGLTNSYVYGLVINPNTPATLYAATVGGGVFKSTNNGSNWVQVNIGLTGLNLYALAIDPSSPNTLYVSSTIDEYKLYKSTNGGANWIEADTGLPQGEIPVIAVDPVSSNILYAGTGQGVYKSINGGANWSPANAGISSESIWDIAIDQTRPNIIYAASSTFSVIKSVDGGAGWNLVSTGLSNSTRSLAINSSNPNILYAGTDNGVYTIQVTPPPTDFNKISPANGSTGVTINPTLSWGSSSGAASYEYCIDTTNDNNCASWTNIGNNTSIALNGLTNGTTYYWQVRAVNKGGQTYGNDNFTAFWSFTAGNTPGSFAKTSPANNATGVSLSPILSWGSSSGATSYEYCYDTTNDNACSTWTTNGSNTSVALSSLSLNTTYYWHVRANNSFGTTYADGTTTAFWPFTTGNIPGAFNKTAPANSATGVSLNPTLSWGTSSGATSYDYCYDTTNDNTCSTWTSNGTNTSINLSGLSLNTTYYWHVRANNSFGMTYSNSSATAFWSFTTGNMPGTFAKTTPTNGATDISTSPTLTWGTSAGATSYEYCYDTTNDNACSSWIANGTATSKALSGLSNNTTYYWHVRATNSFGTTYGDGTATSFWSFTTGNLPGAFGKATPVNSATGISTSPTLSWSASGGATGFEYCYDTTNDNACTNWTSAGANTSVALSGLSLNTIYYWNVRANNSFGTTYSDGTATSFWSFTTGNTPGSFVKTAPTNGTTSVSTSPTLSWGVSSGATSYEYCFDTTNDNACTNWTSNGTNTSVALSGLSLNTPYYWHVRANNSFGTTYSNGSATAFWSFTTGGQAGVILAVSPTISSVALGQNFDVAIEVRAGSQTVDGAAAYMNFNPTYLQVVGITPGSTLPIIIVPPSKDNTTGQVNFAAGTLSNFPSGTFTLLTVTFHAQAVTPSTPITFDSATPRQSDVTFGGSSVLGSLLNGDVTITNTATINGSVKLQGRPTPPDPRWILPLTVTLTVPGNSQQAYTFTPTTDNNGHFVLTGIIPGTYDIRVKNSQTLRNLKASAVLVVGVNTIDFGTLLEGDANDDNYVTLPDFSILVTTYGKCQGTPGYDPRADFNGDGCITLLDFSLLATNFSKGGDQPVTNSISQEAGSQSTEEVTIQVDPPQSNVFVGNTFTVSIKVLAGSQSVDAAQVSLDFDPTKLRVKQVTGNTTLLPQILQNTYDNSKGTLDYAAGTFSNFPSGTFTLVQIQFEAIGETAGTSLTFHHEVPRNTDVTFGGVSILGGDMDGSVIITIQNKVFLPLVDK